MHTEMRQAIWSKSQSRWGRTITLYPSTHPFAGRSPSLHQPQVCPNDSALTPQCRKAKAPEGSRTPFNTRGRRRSWLTRSQALSNSSRQRVSNTRKQPGLSRCGSPVIEVGSRRQGARASPLLPPPSPGSCCPPSHDVPRCPTMVRPSPARESAATPPSWRAQPPPRSAGPIHCHPRPPHSARLRRPSRAEGQGGARPS